MFLQTFSLFVVLLLQLEYCQGDLNVDDFETEVIDSNYIYLVKFFSSMCGSCKEFEPVWNTVVESVAKKVKTGKVNVDKKDGLKIAEKLEVMEDGIPSLVLFTSKGAVPLKLGTRILLTP